MVVDVDVPKAEHPNVVGAVEVVDRLPSAGSAGAAVATGVWLPVVGSTPGVGMSAAELTPRLPISVEPSGMPVRAAPPGVIGVVALGVDEAAMLLAPAPHMPDIPAVSSTPDEVVIPEPCVSPGVGEIPDEESMADPGAVVIPPPSNVDVAPNMADGDVPSVAHAVPVIGTAMLPVTVGAGLIPGEASSVAPRPMPTGETVGPVALVSGDVASIMGVGTAIPVTWADAAPPAESARQTAISQHLMCMLR
ncbi:hypothetical protein H8A99_35520 [Bradyrhizobium sp. Arg68]|uniref:hypothetical protein n=1 Tax=Bradyrhizobium ivorense TaxID=2511166 RepID=UPI001E4AEF0B|nr:hypothetical protein [Bradyrhizobium ivorense]MCC8941606.1 hypothetical protein [Bradyrhizobium ivorense]